MTRTRTVVLLVVALAVALPVAAQSRRALRKARKLLERLELVDGAGSGLDADLLQGQPPDQLAVARAGDADRLGGLGPEAFEPAGDFEPAGGRLSATTSGLLSSGDRIVLDEGTGLEVVSGNTPIHTVFTNRNTSTPIRVRGVAMYNAANTTFLDFEIAPGGMQSVNVAGLGTQWFDVLAVTREPVASVRRLHLTCSFADSSTPAEVAWSCVGER